MILTQYELEKSGFHLLPKEGSGMIGELRGTMDN